jgi:dTDP-L-rhamnose 4-epimerase
VFNIGSGSAVTIREVALQLAEVMGLDVVPRITGKYRAGDIRHCFANIDKARDRLGYEPGVAFTDGLADLAGWLRTQQVDEDVPDAAAELQERGLTV